jgi:uncharacterized membrane protein YdfJ with MMPL/SSD domain
MRRTVAQTGGALAGSALTTAIGFGILVTSTLRPFEQLGYVIVFAIVSSLIAAVLVLPSLLALWDRRDAGRPPARLTATSASALLGRPGSPGGSPASAPAAREERRQRLLVLLPRTPVRLFVAFEVELGVEVRVDARSEQPLGRRHPLRWETRRSSPRWP